MKCHENNNNEQKKGHNPMKHMLHMVICCGMPLLIIAALPFISRFSTRFSIGLAAIVPFICPLAMGFMMFTMFRGNKKKSCCSNNSEEIEESVKYTDVGNQ